MGKIQVAVVFGGRSNEYEVSLRTCVSVLENIDRAAFEPVAVGITRQGGWRLFEGGIDRIRQDSWWQEDCSVPAFLSPDRGEQGGLWVLRESGIQRQAVDVIFPACHGQDCEDGALQGLFKLTGIPYVGCPVTSSALCMDKEYTHIVAEAAGVPMARWQCVRAGQMESFDRLAGQLEQQIGYPMFVKPANSGSSVGCAKAPDRQALAQALALAFEQDEKVLVEQLIEGQEVECAVIGNLRPEAPLVGEVAPTVGFYDYAAKYLDDTANLYIPAHISDEAAQQVKALSKKIFQIMGCRGLARVDFFVQPGDRVVFNEINTLPGFTSISMYPKLMVASGMQYSQLITRLIELAFENHGGLNG